MGSFLWTVALVSTGVGGLWLVPRHAVQGWSLYLGNEVLWAAYAVVTHDVPLTIMAAIWGFVGARNLRLARR
jgi:hypothetical protein